jgi:hypothetical protein
MKSRALFALLAFVAIPGCAPTAEDEAKMVEYVKLDDDYAEVMEKNPTDCKKLEADLSEVTKANQSKADELNKWWDSLSDGKREKLNDKYKRYRMPMAMMKAAPCMDAVKAGMKSK